MKCRSDATSFPFCLISVSSHHSHSHPPEYFPRCGVLVALPSAQGWDSPWHFAPCPVAWTRTNHLSLSVLPPRWLGNCHWHTERTSLPFSSLLCTGRLTSLSNNFFFFFFLLQQTPQQPTNVPTFTSSTRRRCGDLRSNWILGNVVWKSFFFRIGGCPVFLHVLLEEISMREVTVCDYTPGITEQWVEASYEFLAVDFPQWQPVSHNTMMDNKLKVDIIQISQHHSNAAVAGRKKNIGHNS